MSDPLLDRVLAPQANSDALLDRVLTTETEQPPAPQVRGPRSVREAAAPSLRMQTESTPEFYKGAAAGFLGQAGDIYEFGRYTVPEFFGARATPAEQRRTYAPTTEDVSRTLYGERPTGEPGQYRRLGEMIGGVAGLPIKSGGALIGGLGRRVQEAVRPGRVVEQFGEQAPQTSRAVEGVAGAARPAETPRVTGTVSDVGGALGRQIDERLSALRGTRSEEAEKAFSKYFREGSKVENDIIRDYAVARDDIIRQRGGAMSPDMQEVFDKSLGRLQPRVTRTADGQEQFIKPNIEAIEIERRRLRNIAQNYSEEGYSAAQRTFAGELADMFEGIITNRVKDAGEAIKIYREFSDPINRYATALGQRATQRAGEYLPDVPKMDPAQLPGQFFKSRRSVQELKEFTGNPALVESAARRHVGNEIAGMTKPDQVRTYLRNNEDWLQEVPAVRQELSQLADRLQRGETTRSLARLGAIGLGAGASATGVSRLLGGR
jgi:hypothetical protein